MCLAKNRWHVLSTTRFFFSFQGEWKQRQGKKERKTRNSHCQVPRKRWDESTNTCQGSVAAWRSGEMREEMRREERGEEMDSGLGDNSYNGRHTWYTEAVKRMKRYIADISLNAVHSEALQHDFLSKYTYKKTNFATNPHKALYPAILGLLLYQSCLHVSDHLLLHC